MEIQYRLSAAKQLKKIGAKDKPKAKKKIRSLIANPLSGKLLKGELAGMRCLRAWPLRIIYTLDHKKNIIIIETVDYRGDVYK